MPGTESSKPYSTYSSTNLAKHKAVLWPIVMDGQPYSWVDAPGTNMMFRIMDPDYTLHSSTFYRDLLDQVSSLVCLWLW